MPRAEPEAPPSDAVVDEAADEVETPPAAPPPAAEAAVAGSSGGGDGASHLDAASAHGDRDGGGGGRLSVAELSGNLPSLLGDEDANAELVRALSGAEAAAPERVALWQRWMTRIVGYFLVAAGLWWLMNALYFDFLLSSSGGEVCGAKFESMAQSRLEYLVGWAPTYLRGTLLLLHNNIQ
jgi:hypothetical protein